jgi:hypothetical protein
MNHFGAEFRHFGSGIRLCDNDSRAGHPNPFERPEPGDYGRCWRPFKLFYPHRDSFAEFLDPLLIGDNAFVMRHVM